MVSDDLGFVSICDLASQIARKQLSPVEVTDYILERIQALDPGLNSYITVMTESARRTAREAERAVGKGNSLGVLHGVPIALKDLYATKHVRTSFACAAFADWIPDYDASVVESLVNAGAIIIGKHNMHEAAAGSSSLISHYGPVHNPWHSDYIAGGSSGGSAAAVAAGLAYGALGSDTAMSIRQPAAYCGIVGLKPTFGRVSKFGALSLSWSLDHVGPMTRTVQDAALLLQVIAGFDLRDPASARETVPNYMAALSGNIRGLRVGVPRPHFFEECTQSTLVAMEEAIQILRHLGARIQDCALPHAMDAQLAGRLILRCEAAAYHAERLRAQPNLLSSDLRNMLETGRMFSAVQYVQSQRIRNAVAKEFRSEMEHFDALVMPTTPLPSCKAVNDSVSMTGLRMRNTMPFNATGLPAISVPCGFTEDGLPIGLQFVGRAFDEATVLRIANAYEQATEWHTKRPVYAQVGLGGVRHAQLF
jgi:aspartyl-tRNA(Asn)/glutamyl-tRNA(Gln) amidotransferase subunit A